MLPSGDVRVEMWRRVLEVLPDSSLSDERRDTYVETVDVETSAIADSISSSSSTSST